MAIPQVEIKESPVGGRGVFAAKDFEPHDIIEICPTILKPFNLWGKATRDYVWEYKDSCLLALGYGSLYNHNDFANAEGIVTDSGAHLKITANQRIKSGEEIFVNYGRDWWNKRKGSNKVLSS